MLITLKLEKSVTNIPELSRAIDAFETIDEVYRLMQSRDAIKQGARVDFRTKQFKDIKGGELERFNVTSPPEITISADNLWIAALLFILKDYSNAKKNISEAAEDTAFIANLIKSIGEDQYQKAVISAKLFAEQIAEIEEANMKMLKTKLDAALRILRNNIGSINTKGK
ncbi:MAG TPA: hypothetical protein PK372_05275 [Rugosibacter sp.]|nr:hypothetical protein [Rugosibacter sp.]HPB91454.1 hypothetical protein [Rugosibacter sp.]HQN46207.1 hypothetical protein [Rugosibacter sp.]HQQ35325.1 hypothetical protein [Rugosibacter sp.]